MNSCTVILIKCVKKALANSLGYDKLAEFLVLMPTLSCSRNLKVQMKMIGERVLTRDMYTNNFSSVLCFLLFFSVVHFTTQVSANKHYSLVY